MRRRLREARPLVRRSGRGSSGAHGVEGAVVLDASAVLAVLHGEPGHEEIERRLGAEPAIGAVNLSEVVAKLAERGVPEAEIREAVGALTLSVVPLDEDLAYGAGMLRPETRNRGLSFGDRACVALARRLGTVALTMERAWEGLEGVELVRRERGDGKGGGKGDRGR